MQDRDLTQAVRYMSRGMGRVPWGCVRQVQWALAVAGRSSYGQSVFFPALPYAQIAPKVQARVCVAEQLRGEGWLH